MPFQYDVIIFVYVDKSDFIEPTFANNFDKCRSTWISYGGISMNIEL